MLSSKYIISLADVTFASMIGSRVYLLRVLQKKFLILGVDPMKENRAKVKENQKADRSPSRTRKLSVTIAKSMRITKLRVRS
jgi:hypothetical protein